jgi:hypothetical protein
VRAAVYSGYGVVPELTQVDALAEWAGMTVIRLR